MTDAHLIGSIYRAALEPAHLPALLAQVSVHAEAALGHFDIEDGASGEVMFVTAHRMDDEMREQYIRRYRALDPRRTLLEDAPPGEWKLTQDHFDDAFLRRDPFFRDFAIPRGGGHGAITRLELGPFRGFFCLGRGLRQGPFPEAARERLANLTPHLRQASSITARMANALSLQAAMAALLDHVADAVLVVTRAGRLLTANAAGLALLDAEDGLYEADHEVRSTDAKAGTLLAAAIEVASRISPRRNPAAPVEATLRIPRRSSARPWLMSILPVAPPTDMGAVGGTPCAALWIRDAGREKRITPEWLQYVLQVTPAEARVSHAIYLGASLQAAAEQLGIGEATAKTHLANVFAKTGVHRQADLVRFIAQLKPNFG